MKISITITFLFLYIIIIILYVIWMQYNKSLIKVHNYTTKFIYDFIDEKNIEFEKTYKKEVSLFLLKCCIFSSILYSKPKVTIYNDYFKFDKLHHIYTYSFIRKKQFCGFLAVQNNKIIITLKSTGNLNDIYVSSEMKLHDVDDGKIHRGYYTQSIEILSEVLEIIFLYPNIKQIYITGHSLGGTLANILGYLLKKILKKVNIIVYSFGSLKFGNSMLRYNIEKIRNLKLINVLNSADLVTQKPLNMEYVRIGDTVIHRIDTGNDNINHGIKVYKECILKIFKEQSIKRDYTLTENLFRLFLNFIG